MFKQRARLKGALEAPVRRALQPVADRRAAVRDLNADILAAAKEQRDVIPAAATPQRERGPYVDPLSAAVTSRGAAEPEADPFI